MIDINLIRNNKELVKENIRKKFQEHKIIIVDEIEELDKKNRELKIQGDNLRSERNKISDSIGTLFKEGKTEEANQKKKEVIEINDKLIEIEKQEEELNKVIREKMMVIPNIIDPSVPIGHDDSENVELEKIGTPLVPDYDIPYHADILESLGGLDKTSAGKTSGNGFYYLMGDVARLSSALLSYARDFMIEKGFTYCIPPFMISRDVGDGGMSCD